MMNYTPFIGFGLHVVFETIFFFGFIAALIWMARFAKKEAVVKITIWTLLIGILGSILTVPSTMSAMHQMMRWVKSDNYVPEMPAYDADREEEAYSMMQR